MAKETYYDILGVKPDASETEIKQAYRKLVRKYHPDVSSESNATEMTGKINQAYNTLKNKEKRTEYDAMLRNPFTRETRENHDFDFNAFQQRGAAEQTGFQSDFRFDDIFSAFNTNRQSFRQEHGPIPGEDRHAELTIDIAAAYQGSERHLTLNIPVFSDDGHLSQQQKTLNVTIPKGIAEGQQIRLSGQGMPGLHGGKSGDLFLKIRFRESPQLYVKQQKDVHMRVNVMPWQLALAEEITVDTPAGKFTLRLPPATQPGQKIRLKGKGIPARTPGDLYIHPRLVLPETDTDADKAAWQALAAHYRNKA